MKPPCRQRSWDAHQETTAQLNGEAPRERVTDPDLDDTHATARSPRRNSTAAITSPPGRAGWGTVANA